MIRLNVNVRKHKAGSLVAEEELGSAFADQLVAAGQAERVTVEPTDPVEAVLLLVHEVGDRFEGLTALIDSIVAQAEPLEDQGRVQVALALRTTLEAKGPSGPTEALMALLALADRPVGPETDSGDAGNAPEVPPPPPPSPPASEAASSGTQPDVAPPPPPPVNRPVPTRPARAKPPT